MAYKSDWSKKGRTPQYILNGQVMGKPLVLWLKESLLTHKQSKTLKLVVTGSWPLKTPKQIASLNVQIRSIKQGSNTANIFWTVSVRSFEVRVRVSFHYHYRYRLCCCCWWDRFSGVGPQHRDVVRFSKGYCTPEQHCSHVVNRTPVEYSRFRRCRLRCSSFQKSKFQG